MTAITTQQSKSHHNIQWVISHNKIIQLVHHHPTSITDNPNKNFSIRHNILLLKDKGHYHMVNTGNGQGLGSINLIIIVINTNIRLEMHKGHKYF